MASEQTFDLIIGGDYHDGARAHQIAGRLYLRPQTGDTTVLTLMLDDGRTTTLVLEDTCTFAALRSELTTLLRPDLPATAGYCGGEDAPGPSTAPS